MAEYLIQDTTLSEIADAIRVKTELTRSIGVSEMASLILGIKSGPDTSSYAYLYNNGNQYESLTGGYTAVAKKAASTASGTGAPTITYNNSSMTIQPKKSSSAGIYSGGIVRTTNKINCNNYSKLVFKGTISGIVDGFNSAAISIWTEIGSNNQTENRVRHQKLSNEITTITIDVSNLTSSYYIGFGFDSQNTQIEVNVSELYLE